MRAWMQGGQPLDHNAAVPRGFWRELGICLGIAVAVVVARDGPAGLLQVDSATAVFVLLVAVSLVWLGTWGMQ